MKTRPEVIRCGRRLRRPWLAVVLTVPISAVAAVLAWTWAPHVIGPGVWDAAVDDGHVLACVRSQAGGPVQFQVRWSDEDPWRTVVAHSDTWLALVREPGVDDASETTLQVRYDDDPGDGMRVVGQQLRVGQSMHADCRQPVAAHAFRVRDGELFLDFEADAADDETDAPPNNQLASPASMV